MRDVVRRRRSVGAYSRLPEIVALAFAAVLSVITARSIPGMSGHVPKPLVAALALAGAAILMTLTAEQLLLGWLALASLLQESAGKTHIGHLMSLAFYTVPPLLFGIKVLFTRGSRPRREWFDFLPGIYVLFIFGSIIVTASGELKTGTVGTIRTFYQNVALGALIYYVLVFWRGKQFSTLKITRIVLAMCALQAVMCIVEWGTGWNLWDDTSWQQAGDIRAIGTLSNPALTGAFIGSGIVIALAVLGWTGVPELRRLAIVMLIVGFPGLYATKTRGPILATLIACVACLLLSSRLRLIGSGAIALAVILVIMFWPQIRSSSVYQNRIDQQGNVEARLVLQEISFKLAEERPIIGWGYDSFDRVKFDVPITSSSLPLSTVLESTSHDTFLTILVEFGAIGLVLFVLPFAAVIWRALRYARRAGPDQWFYVAGLGTITVIGITAGTLDYRFYSFIPMLAWMFLGLVRRQTITDAAMLRAPTAETL
jgi:O-antigen ligase